jgi:hypothetical protein
VHFDPVQQSDPVSWADADEPGHRDAAAEACDLPRPRSRSTPHVRLLAFCLWPHLPPPGNDRLLVAFDRAVLGHLRAEPDAV